MRFSYVLLVALFALGCQETKTNETTAFIEELPIEKKDTIRTSQEVLKEEDTRGKPIWGYRFVLLGDFDGDQIQDTLTEHYVDAHTKQETNKFFENEDILMYQDGELIDHETYSYMRSNNLDIETFRYTSHLGVFYAETIGDIDGDGADEIGVVEHHADYSSVNSYHIYTYNKGWKRYYSFEVRDWEFPALPEYNTIYGMFGAMDKLVISDSAQNKRIEEELKAYQRVKIIAPNTIEFVAFDIGDCEINYVYKTYEDSILWVVPEFPIQDKNIVSIWTEYELYGDDELENIKKQIEPIEVCDPAMDGRQRVQFKKSSSNNHLVQ